MNFIITIRVAVAACLLFLLAACNSGGGGSSGSGGFGNAGNPGNPGSNGGDPANICAVARVAAAPSDLITGPVARSAVGDLVIENGLMRAVVQKAGRNWYNISQFGGNIIDAVLLNSDGTQAAGDQFEEAALGTNIESSPNYQSVVVLNPGGPDGLGGCTPAVIRATGPDDLLDFVNGSSAIRDMGFMFPDSADDVDLPVTIQTDYILDMGRRYVTTESRLINQTGTAQNIYMVEYLNGSGELEFFQYGYGFGEPLLTAPCASCRVAIYAGHEGGSGVSYGIIHDFANSSSLSVSGVSIPVYGTDALLLAATGATAAPPPFTVPANGELLITRHFAVGDGTVASIMDVKHELFGEVTGVLQGQVTDDNGPVSGAEIAVLTSVNDFPAGRGPDLIVANHFRTDDQGRYAGTLRPGTYQLRLNVPNRLAGSPSQTNVSVVANSELTQDFTAPLPARLRVTVIDENGAPLPAKVQLIGSENSPDANEPGNSESVLLGVVTVESGVFGDINADPLPNGIILTEFAVADPTETGAVTPGTTDILEIEPGTYQLSVSRGMRYSEHVQMVTLNAGQLAEISARLVLVVPTPNHVFGDFHVHSFDSPDSEVTNRERVATYMAEGIEFFTPSDHGMRVDFEPVIADMGVGAWVASAPSSEITTFDYGHFNAWPVRIDTSPANTDEMSQSAGTRISQGSTDWGNPAPPGEDFPSQNNYGFTPGQIFDDAKAEPFTSGRETVAQINHIEGHFGQGLQIDTGLEPPQSAVDARTRRLDPAINNFFNDGFDSLELWIGVDGRVAQFTHFLGENLGDWFNMLNQNIISTFVSNSDTHERRLTSLSTRNIISLPAAGLTNGNANLGAIRVNPHTVGDQVIAGRTTGTNSLFLQVKASNANGDVAGLEVTDSFGLVGNPLPLAAGNESITLAVTVQSATWAEYNRIQVFINGETQRQADDTGLLPADPPRYNVCPPTIELVEGAAGAMGFTRNTVDVATIDSTTYQRFETSVNIPVLAPSPGEDYWLVVLAQGTDGETRSLWPVVPNDYTDNDGDLLTRSPGDIGTLALAASNPIFVDADGDGVWTAPGVRTHAGTGTDTCDGGVALPLPEIPVDPFDLG